MPTAETPSWMAIVREVGAPAVSTIWSAFTKSAPRADAGSCSVKKSAASKAPVPRICTTVSVSGRSAPSGPGFMPGTPCALTVRLGAAPMHPASAARAAPPKRTALLSSGISIPPLVFVCISEIAADLAQEPLLGGPGDVAVPFLVELPELGAAAPGKQGLEKTRLLELAFELLRIEAVDHAPKRGLERRPGADLVVSQVTVGLVDRRVGREIAVAAGRQQRLHGVVRADGEFQRVHVRGSDHRLGHADLLLLLRPCAQKVDETICQRAEPAPDLLHLRQRIVRRVARGVKPEAAKEGFPQRAVVGRRSRRALRCRLDRAGRLFGGRWGRAGLGSALPDAREVVARLARRLVPRGRIRPPRREV